MRNFKVMISTRHRFHGYGSLKYVYRHGHTVRGPLFAIKSVDNPKRKSYRLAVVVSKKVNKSAVARNRIRRRLYEGVREMEGDIGSPVDIVLSVYNDAVLQEPWPNLQKQLRKQLSEAGALHKSKATQA
jgi:ribonuclease P protein component